MRNYLFHPQNSFGGQPVQHLTCVIYMALFNCIEAVQAPYKCFRNFFRHGPLPEENHVGRTPHYFLDGIFRILDMGVGGNILQSQNLQSIINNGARPGDNQWNSLNNKDNFFIPATGRGLSSFFCVLIK